jgi:hypothetical protein
MNDPKDDRKPQRTETAWEGGGRHGTAPEQEGHPTDEHDVGRTDRYLNADDGNEHNRREIPGGSYHPASTPGGTGPSTRDTANAVSGDANESLIGRAELAGEVQAKPQRQEYDPDR